MYSQILKNRLTKIQTKSQPKIFEQRKNRKFGKSQTGRDSYGTVWPFRVSAANASRRCESQVCVYWVSSKQRYFDQIQNVCFPERTVVMIYLFIYTFNPTSECKQWKTSSLKARKVIPICRLRIQKKSKVTMSSIRRPAKM